MNPLLTANHPTDSSGGLLPRHSDPLRYGGQTDDPREAPGVILRCVPEGSSVLDVGCGRGIISALIRDKRRCRVIGIEPNPDRARAASQAGLETINAYFSAGTVAGLPPFDVVVFADVLEHLVEPVDALRLARTLLKSGGRIVASVPNVAHWSVRLALLRGRFDYEDSGIMDVTHVRWFTAATLSTLFASAGYRIESMVGTAGTWMPVYRMDPAFRFLRSSIREKVIVAALRRWPALFACQHVVNAVPIERSRS